MWKLVHCDENLNWQTPIVDSSLMDDCTVNCTCPSIDGCHISAIKLSIIENTIYEADEYQGGEAYFVQAGPSSIWGFSNTGHFWDASRTAGYYIAKNAIEPFRVLDDEYLTFNNIVVKNKTIEISFYWAGKGTRAVPTSGIYGPLISAMSAESNFKPPPGQKKKIFIVVGALAFAICLVFMILFILWWTCSPRSITSREQALRGLELKTGLFAFQQIKAATNNFDDNNKIGEGGFGSIYKLWECQLKLDWPTRLSICIGIARGLAFLHEKSRLKIVHRDIQATNVLLDGNLNPKISDFGLAKLTEDKNTHISTRIAGTIGYMAPEYALWGILTHKADVYSFGVVTLEIVTGKNNMKYHPSQNFVGLLDWAFVLQHKGCLMGLVDPKLGSKFDNKEAIRMIMVALLCTNPSPARRPAMSAVVSMLEGHDSIQGSIMDPSNYGDEFRFEALRDKYDDMQLQSSSDNQTLVDSLGTTRNGSSSTYAHDLYPINLDSP
ncbi:unnamed protein product [Camellia sinensis]